LQYNKALYNASIDGDGIMKGASVAHSGEIAGTLAQIDFG
jgi:hypothetical protein